MTCEGVGHTVLAQKPGDSWTGMIFIKILYIFCIFIYDLFIVYIILYNIYLIHYITIISHHILSTILKYLVYMYF